MSSAQGPSPGSTQGSSLTVHAGAAPVVVGASAPASVSAPAATPSSSSSPRGKQKSGVKFAGPAEALAWLSARVDVERMNQSRLAADTLKLDRMVQLLARLDDPHRAFKSVHVAGTKGKGSTCAMTAACLRGCGYAVGLYTSPHLVDLRERIKINDQMIEPAGLARLVQMVADASAGLDQELGEPTFFEVLTACAFLHFAEQAVDVAVIEVGLGGRLDSTNVITPEVAAITSISLDHTKILGDTVEKIAREKAGIFKPGVPALVIQQKPSVLEVFRQHAAIVGCPVQVVGVDVDFSVRFEASQTLGPHMRVSVSSPRNTFEHIAVPLKGEHQAYNCGLALAIVDKLSELGFKTPEDGVTQGLASVKVEGRMEMVPTRPRLLLDGAHNADSVKCLIKAIGAQARADSMVVIFGCASDKDIDGMLRELALGADKVVFTRIDSPRSADPKDLSRKFTEASGKMSQVAGSLEDAIDLAKRAVGRDDLICVTGSLYLVGEAKRYLAGRGIR